MTRASTCYLPLFASVTDAIVCTVGAARPRRGAKNRHLHRSPCAPGRCGAKRHRREETRLILRHRADFYNGRARSCGGARRSARAAICSRYCGKLGFASSLTRLSPTRISPHQDVVRGEMVSSAARIARENASDRIRLEFSREQRVVVKIGNS